MADTAKDKDVIDQEDVEVEEEETTTTTTTTKKTSQWHKTRTTKVSTNVCTYFPGEQEILGRNGSTTKRVPSLKRQEDEAFPGRCV
ncbi:GD21529 [Drosophila simulans]|uniref:GD21529 n=1 Tax=Drosophila simulans TaxID=7240 RepID=B4R275_DROSI|nr:GD21529 [Drosophila simulans]